MNNNNTQIWGFDIGKASLGEAVWCGGKFKHVESLILDKDFAEIKTSAGRRRQARTRKAHKAREEWLEKCLEDCGIEILKRRKVGIVNGQWKLISKGDARLEKEFPAEGEEVCYNSIALRCKLILGEKLESWQIFKALNSSIQHRGYDENIPWKETQNESKKEDGDYFKKIVLYESEKEDILNRLPQECKREDFDFPCFFKAKKMGIWSEENPYKVGLRISNNAQKAKGYVIPRKYVESEFVRLVQMASLQYPKLKDKQMFILYGISETPYASLFKDARKKFGLKRGSDSDWTALGQKIPRFDNRMIGKCKLIPRLNTCKIKSPDKIKSEEDLLHYDITLALKLLNLRFFKDSEICALSFEEFKKLFEIGKSNKYKISKTDLKKFLKSIGASVLSQDHSEIEAPRTSGRSSFSRPAMKILKELIFSGEPPSKFLKAKIDKIANTDPNKGIIREDLDFIRIMGDCPWNGIFIPDVETYKYASQTQESSEAQINKLIGSQNDPIVRHRLSFFYERIKALSEKFGVPDKIVLEFVREDFMGKQAKKDLSLSMKKRFEEKIDIAKKLDDIGYKGNKMLLKMELLQKQGFACLYTGEALQETDLPILEIEHIVPRSLGGPDAAYNYVLTSESTNKAKGNQTPYKWLSPDRDKWRAYTERVRARAAELGSKRCRLLLSENAEELINKYTALAETAWISKLAQRIVCMHFGFQFGGNTGEKRVFTVPGNITAKIRSAFGLNKILHNIDADKKNMSELDIVKLDYELDKKNRKNKKHHALDAMCLCFAPTGPNAQKLGIGALLPPEIAAKAEEFFRGYIEKVVPNEVAPKKPKLEESIYSKRTINGKECIVRKFNLIDLAYKSGLKPVYDISAIEKLLEDKPKKIPPIINPTVRRIVRDFVSTNPNEDEWRNWCKTVRMPSKNRNGTRIIRVLVYVGTPEEYKDLSKDGCGAFRKGDSHKGQIIWMDKNGRYKVSPVYVHSSKSQTMESIKSNPDFIKTAGFFKSHCLVEIESPVVNGKGDVLLSPGTYMINTIMAAGMAILSDTNGVKSPAININYLMNAGMRRVSIKYK